MSLHKIGLMKCLIIPFLCLSVLCAQAVNSSASVELLKSVEGYYSKKSIQIDFNYAWKASEGKEFIEKGSFFFTDTWYKLILPEQDIYFDGSSQWTYFKDRKEVQITQSSLDESAFHPLKFARLYKSKSFKSRVVQDEKGIAIVELVPADRDQEYHKVVLSILKNQKQIRKVEVYYKNGDRYRIELLKHTPTKKLHITDFQLNTDGLPGVHVEDLR